LNKKWQSPTITKSALDYFSVEILVMAGTWFWYIVVEILLSVSFQLFDYIKVLFVSFLYDP
jgi:hypothetical protein